MLKIPMRLEDVPVKYRHIEWPKLLGEREFKEWAIGLADRCRLDETYTDEQYHSDMDKLMDIPVKLINRSGGAE